MKKLSHITILDQYAVDMDIVLGQGSTGSVYQGLDMKTGRKVAVKIVDLRTIDNQVAQYLLNMEKIALMSVKNPYILQGFRVTQDPKYCFMVTQYCNGGTLKRYIKNSKNGFLSEQKALNIMHSLLLGQRSLIQKGIVHRDLKPANIMLQDDTPKIIDFGYCEIKGYPKPSLQYNVGSPSYMAPQSFETNIYNEKTEVWAMGVILFQCLTGRTIDEGRHMSEVYRQIQDTGVPYPSHVTFFSRNIINWCLSKNPKNRPTFEQLIDKYFNIKSRSVSKKKTQIENSSFYKRYQICKKESSNNINKVLHQNINTKRSPTKLEQTLFKSYKIEGKIPYKVPQFLQLSQKGKTQKLKQAPRLQTCFSTRNQLVETKYHKYLDKENFMKGSNMFQANNQYANYNFTKNNLEKRKKLNVNQIFEKVYKSDKNDIKNRVYSTQTSVSPSQKLFKKISNSKYENLPLKKLSKDFLSRNKRTVTQRNNYLRA